MTPLFADRVEVTSMGGLPYGVAEEDFFSGFSVPRNKEIMRVFRDLEIVEQLGSGIPRIIKVYGREAFEIRKSFLRVVMPYAKPFERDEATSEGKSSGIELVDGFVDGLAESQQRILILIKANPRISKREMANSIGISTTAIDKHIIALKDKGLLQRIDSDKAGYWAILENARE